MTLDPTSNVHVVVDVTAEELRTWTGHRTFRFFVALGDVLAAMNDDASLLVASEELAVEDAPNPPAPAPESASSIAEGIEAEPPPVRNLGGRPPKYSDGQKIEMVEYYAIHGRAKTAKHFGVSPGFITTLARKAPETVEAARKRAGWPEAADAPEEPEESPVLVDPPAPDEERLTFVTTPIERRPFDPQAARQGAADGASW